MSKIGLCAKVCWFIYAQIVLLQLTHHYQSANAQGEPLTVYFEPTGIQYFVYVHGMRNGIRTEIATGKTNHTTLKVNAVGSVHVDVARAEEALLFNYNILTGQQILDD
uniref:IgGFc_binding domain-containing protein n=1 Tax=Globodera pallida TaxID=36090 RepID=A0A183BLD7_GLOPA